MVFALLLNALLHDCAATAGVRTMTAIVRVESGGDALAMHDNTSGRTLSPPNRSVAVAWADELIALGHSVDLGLAQIDSANLAPLGLTTADAFDPCANLRAGATILHGDYREAAGRYGAGQIALRHAIGAYNTGSIFAGANYVDRILDAAGYRAPAVTMPDLVSTARLDVVRPRVRVSDGGTAVFRRAKAPPVASVSDAAQPQMIVIGTPALAAAHAGPVVIVGP